MFMCPQPARGGRQHLHAEQVGPRQQDVGAASQAHYLESLTSEPSLEDDVGRGPPLLRSLALASEASASAQKGGVWLARGR